MSWNTAQKPDTTLDRFWIGAPPKVLAMPKRTRDIIAMNTFQRMHLFSRLKEEFESVHGPCPKDQFRLVNWHECGHPGVVQRLYPLGVPHEAEAVVFKMVTEVIFSEVCDSCSL